MATVVMGHKSSRLDLRMTDEEKREIELAAHINGVSVSQWSLHNLMTSARRDIAEHRAIQLSRSAFDRFAELLEEPVDPTFVEFQKGSTRWDQ